MTVPVVLILHSHNVHGSITASLIQTLLKLAFIHDQLVVNNVVELVLPFAARSMLAVGAILTPIGCVKYNGLVSLFRTVVTLEACVPP